MWYICVYLHCVYYRTYRKYMLFRISVCVCASGNNNHSSFHYFSNKANLVGNMRISTMEASITTSLVNTTAQTTVLELFLYFNRILINMTD